MPIPVRSRRWPSRRATRYPFVREALRCHCARFPSVATGLNEIETATLDTLDRGPIVLVSSSARSPRIHARDGTEWATCSSSPACAGSRRWSAPPAPTSPPPKSSSRRSAARCWRGVVTGSACARSTPGSAAFTSRATIRAGAGTAPTAGWSIEVPDVTLRASLSRLVFVLVPALVLAVVPVLFALPPLPLLGRLMPVATVVRIPARRRLVRPRLPLAGRHAVVADGHSQEGLGHLRPAGRSTHGPFQLGPTYQPVGW